MLDFTRELLSLHNLPCTALLGVVMFYWLLVIFGVLENDFEGGGVEAADAVDALEPEFGRDAPAPLSVSTHGEIHSATGASALSEQRRSRFFSFGEVPLSIAGTFLALFMWMVSMAANFYLNGTPGNRSLTTAFLLLFPNAFVSFVLTRIAIIPLDRLFTALRHTATENERVLGREARVISATVDERYGQAEIATNAAPVLVNVRVAPGHAPMTRGTPVTITSREADGAYYFVTPVTDTQPAPHDL